MRAIIPLKRWQQQRQRHQKNFSLAITIWCAVAAAAASVYRVCLAFNVNWRTESEHFAEIHSVVCSILALLLSCFALTSICRASMSLECKVVKWETKRTFYSDEKENMECCLAQCLDDNRKIVLQFSEIPSNQIMALNFWHGIYARQFKKPPHTQTHLNRQLCWERQLCCSSLSIFFFTHQVLTFDVTFQQHEPDLFSWMRALERVK